VDTGGSWAIDVVGPLAPWLAILQSLTSARAWSRQVICGRAAMSSDAIVGPYS
jgi:hypothetical protein